MSSNWQTADTVLSRRTTAKDRKSNSVSYVLSWISLTNTLTYSLLSPISCLCPLSQAVNKAARSGNTITEKKCTSPNLLSQSFSTLQLSRIQKLLGSCRGRRYSSSSATHICKRNRSWKAINCVCFCKNNYCMWCTFFVPTTLVSPTISGLSDQTIDCD